MDVLRQHSTALWDRVLLVSLIDFFFHATNSFAESKGSEILEHSCHRERPQWLEEHRAKGESSVPQEIECSRNIGP